MSRTIVAAATLALAVTSLAPASMAQAALDIQASPSPAPSASPAMTTAMTLGARASSARARAFTVRAPKTVRTSERFRVTGAVPRSYAASPAVVEIRRGSSWIPLASAKVSRTGKVSVRAQLSQPGKHQLRVRVPRKPTAALSQTLTVSSRGNVPKAEGPARMLAHFTAQQDAPVMRLSPRADPPAGGLEVAGDAAESALSVKSLAKGLAEGAAEGVGSFGAELILGLMFPGRSTASEAQIEELQAEVQAGFNNVYYDLQLLQDGIANVETQNSEIFAEASMAACNSALSSVKGNVDTIQTTFLNYQNVLTESWGEENLSYSGGAANATVMGNYIFGTGSNATPSFGPGINQVQVAVADLEQSFTETRPFNIINTCADAIAGYVIQQEAAGVTAPSDQLPIGVLEAAYAEVMQNLVGQYAAIINTGLALVGTDDFLAAATLVPPTVTTVPQFLDACQELDVFSCPDIAQEIQSGQDLVSDMWHLGGASWGQVTNGTLRSDLYATNGSTTFSAGDNAWLTDIVVYQEGVFGVGPSQEITEGVSSAENYGPLVHPQVQGTTSLPNPQWGPLTFSVADSAAWNGIVRTSYNTQPYPNAQGTILAACGGPSLTNCSNPDALADYLNGAGLVNDGEPFNAAYPVIFYTGESYDWNPNYSAISPALGYMGSGQGYVWNGEAQLGNLQALSFLDTSMLPNNGVSAVVNDPATYDFATGDGTIGNLTLGDVFPFTTNGNKNPGGDTYIATSITMQNYSDGYNLVSIPCSSWAPVGDYASQGGSWTVMNWLAPGNGSTNDYGNGCGWTRYFPDGGAPESSSSINQLSTGTSQMPGFYTNPVANMVIEGWNGTSSYPSVIKPCSWPVSPGYPPQCTSAYPDGWNALPGFVTAINGTPVQPQNQQQYLWPVVPTQQQELAESCPSVDSGSNVTAFSQGNTGIGFPQTCTTLFDEWLAVAASQDIGPVSVQVGAQTGQPGGGYLATVSFFNSADSSVSMDAGFLGAQGATVSAAPSGSGVNSCTTGPITDIGALGFTCSLSLAPGQTTLSVPLTFAPGSTTGTLFVGATNSAAQYVAGTTAQVTTAAAISNAVPFGVTGLSAVFETSTVNAAGGGTVTLGWSEPYSMGSITSYVVTGTGPAGSTPIDDTIPASQVTVQSNGQITTQVDISQGGSWTFTVAAASSAGVGPPDTLTTYIGEAPPLAPRNLSGRELPDGQVALAWQPSVASPAVEFYTVRWWSGVSTTPPSSAAALVPGPDWVSSGAGSSMVGAVSVANPRYFVPPLPTTGPWTFQITATNTMGTSTPSTFMVNMQGFVPSRPISFAVEVNPVGTVNAEWTASPFGVPAPTSYTVGLYAPPVCTSDDTCTTSLLASQTIDAITPRGPSGVFDLFTLGRNSKAGVYTVVVYATNSLGDGGTARSSILLTPGFIKRLAAAEDPVDIAGAKLPPTLEALTKLECRRGVLSGSLCKML